MLLCRQRGYAPTWCVGVVATPPFAAHAWIEADDRIVDEPIDASYLRTFYRVGASRPGVTGPHRWCLHDRALSVHAHYRSPTFWRRWRLSQPTGIGIQKVTRR